jgi:hypothetical protein
MHDTACRHILLDRGAISNPGAVANFHLQVYRHTHANQHRLTNAHLTRQNCAG